MLLIDEHSFSEGAELNMPLPPPRPPPFPGAAPPKWETLPSQARNADMLQFANANLPAAEWVWSEQRKDTSVVLGGSEPGRKRSRGQTGVARLAVSIHGVESRAIRLSVFKAELHHVHLMISLVRRIGFAQGNCRIVQLQACLALSVLK